MLAARDQENLVHGHQTVAASKALNENTRALQSKTPGQKAPKTPFKLQSNIENVPLAGAGGRTALKANGKQVENWMTGGKKALGAEKNTFVTPMAPRNRAPLGQKTTNAKARPFQTPAVQEDGAKTALKSTQKNTVSRRPKQRVSHAETQKVELHSEGLQDEREIEYMPPTPKDLPDYPDDFPHDMKYPQFENGNLMRGLYSTYFNPVGDDGLTRSERATKEAKEKSDKKIDQQILKAVNEIPLYGYDTPEYEGDVTALEQQRRDAQEQRSKEAAEKDTKATLITARKPLAITAGPSKASSLKAASLLSNPAAPTLSKPSSRPTIPAPKSKTPFSRLSRAPKPVSATNPSSMRSTASSAASRTTLGYSKGRAVSSSLRRDPSSTELPHGSGPSAVSKGTTRAVSGPSRAPPLFTAEEWRNISQGRLVDEEEEEELEGGEDEAGGLEVAMGRASLGGEDLLDEEAAQEFELMF